MLRLDKINRLFNGLALCAGLAAVAGCDDGTSNDGDSGIANTVDAGVVADAGELPFDPDTMFEPRARALISQMTTEEKVSQLIADSNAIPRLGVADYNWWSEALHGVARAGLATVFPQAINMAAMWDTPLMYDISTVIGIEGRARHHEYVRTLGYSPISGGLNFFAPNINLARDPRWGRMHETYGEDPFLTGRNAVAFVRGMQGEDPVYYRAIATVKHFAVHSGPEATRNEFDARVSARDLEESYLPHFEAAVREGHVRSVMAAYNAVNGAPASASTLLLEDILRQRWGFRGYVVGDCDAIAHIYDRHHFADSYMAGAAVGLRAGTDLDCGETFLMLTQAEQRGLITVAEIDRAITRLYLARFRLGLFDTPEQVDYQNIPLSEIDSPEHRALALRASRESVVLLHNPTGVLPIADTVRSIAVIGPTADRDDIMLANYNGVPSSITTILEGLRDYAPTGVDVRYAQGCDLLDPSHAGFTAATSLASSSDVVVAVLGMAPTLENEEGGTDRRYGNGDRPHLQIPGQGQQLLEALVATGKPVIVVATGGPVELGWAKEHAAGILWAGYPGQEGGRAVADVIYGRYNPAGRLPITFYASASDLPDFSDYRMAGHTYRFFEGTPVFEFGEGLSYTSFRYENPTVPATASTSTPLEVSVDVVNTSTRDGDEVVEVYAIHPGSAPPGPRRTLVAFTRVQTTAGATSHVTLQIRPHELATVDDEGVRAVHAGMVKLAIGGRQPRADGTYATGAGVTADVMLQGDTFEGPFY